MFNQHYVVLCLMIDVLMNLMLFGFIGHRYEVLCLFGDCIMYVTDWNLDPMMSDVFVFCFDFDVTTFGIGLFQ